MPPPALSLSAAPQKGFWLVKTNPGDGQAPQPQLAAGELRLSLPSSLFNSYVCRKSDYESQHKPQSQPGLLQGINSAV